MSSHKVRAKITGESKEVPIEILHPNPYQPRQKFSEASIVELAFSLKSFGQMQDVFVVTHPEVDGEYLIVSGERRWRAAQHNGWGTVRCFVSAQSLSPQQLAQLALVENEVRESLTLIELASQFDLFRRPVEEGGFGMSVSAIARISPKYHRTTIQNLLSLLTLPEEVQVMIEEGRLGNSQAKIIVSLPRKFQLQMARATVKNDWSVRQLTNNTSHLTGLTGKRKRTIDGGGPVDPTVRAIQVVERHASELLGAHSVLKKYGGDKWEFSVKVNSLDELNGVLEKIGIDVDEDLFKD